MKTTVNNSALLTPDQAANHLGIAAHTLAVWRSTGRYNLPFIKVGRMVKYRQTDLDAFLARRTIGVTPEAA